MAVPYFTSFPIIASNESFERNILSKLSEVRDSVLDVAGSVALGPRKWAINIKTRCT